MTKRYFIKLAAAITLITDDMQRTIVARRIGEVCAASNDLFNWSIWYPACNVEIDK